MLGYLFLILILAVNPAARIPIFMRLPVVCAKVATFDPGVRIAEDEWSREGLLLE